MIDVTDNKFFEYKIYLIMHLSYNVILRFTFSIIIFYLKFYALLK